MAGVAGEKAPESDEGKVAGGNEDEGLNFRIPGMLPAKVLKTSTLIRHMRIEYVFAAILILAFISGCTSLKPVNVERVYLNPSWPLAENQQEYADEVFAQNNISSETLRCYRMINYTTDNHTKPGEVAIYCRQFFNDVPVLVEERAGIAYLVFYFDENGGFLGGADREGGRMLPPDIGIQTEPRVSMEDAARAAKCMDGNVTAALEICDSSCFRSPVADDYVLVWLIRSRDNHSPFEPYTGFAFVDATSGALIECESGDIIN